jgi:hypothetical protein
VAIGLVDQALAQRDVLARALVVLAIHFTAIFGVLSAFFSRSDRRMREIYTAISLAWVG